LFFYALKGACLWDTFVSNFLNKKKFALPFFLDMKEYKLSRKKRLRKGVSGLLGLDLKKEKDRRKEAFLLKFQIKIICSIQK
jgi:hypothetical protein